MACSFGSLQPYLSSNLQAISVEVGPASDVVDDEEQTRRTPTLSDSMLGPRDEVEEIDLPMVLIQDIPKMRYHEKPLHFMSEPGITQDQYEHMILSGA